MSTKYNIIGRPYQALDIAAGSIPYDPTGSGLAATDVQDAIDELAEQTNGGVFAGHVGSDGTTGNVLRSGWAATALSTGIYEITMPDLGTTNYAVVATMSGSNAPGRIQVSSYNKTSSSFEIHWYNQTDGPGFVDTEFDFMLTLI